MAIVNAIRMLQDALYRQYAVGAFNITNFMTMQALIETADVLRTPLIIQTSESVAADLGPSSLVSMFRKLAEPFDAPICLHLDQCTDAELARQCARAGYTSLMFAARHPNFQKTLSIMGNICEYCHQINLSVEGAADQAWSPQQTAEYVRQTGVDVLAVTYQPALAPVDPYTPPPVVTRLREIDACLNQEPPGTPLVIRGATSLPAESVKQLVQHGVAKFDVATALQQTLVDRTHASLSRSRYEYRPEQLTPEVKQAVVAEIRVWMQLLGCIGKAA